jgi:hypothetical protein
MQYPFTESAILYLHCSTSYLQKIRGDDSGGNEDIGVR